MNFLLNQNLLIRQKYRDMTPEKMEQWKLFVEEFEVNLFFAFDMGNEYFSDNQAEVFAPLFSNGIPDFSFEMKLFSSSDLKSELLDFMKEKQIELLLIEYSNSSEYVLNDIPSEMTDNIA